MVNLIWAMTEDGVIANNGQLPWNIKEEMAYFREKTLNKTVLMGSKTFISIKKPLKNRKNIIISSKTRENYINYVNEYCIITNDLIKILKQYQGNKNEDIWVIGGANIYEQAFEYADYLYVSIIKEKYFGDLKFPKLEFNNFELIEKTNYNEFSTYIYIRKEQ